MPKRAWWEKWTIPCFVPFCFPWRPCFQNALLFLSVVCAFCCMKYMLFCDLSPLEKLETLPFQYRSDCVHSPADLRESVKDWPSHTSAWQLSCCEHPHWKAKVAGICLPDYVFFFPVTLSHLFFQMHDFFWSHFAQLPLAEMFLLVCISGTGTLHGP